MAIIISNLSKTINKVPVLTDINMELEPGKVYGLKGKNGSGKTMLMRAICGLIIPTEGTITIDGEVIGEKHSFPKSIGVLIENPAFLNNYTGFENLELLASIKGIIDDKDISDAMEMVGLDPKDKRTYKKYSLGMKQRLGIAAAFMEYPDIVILDEPINALDEAGAKLIRVILEKLKSMNKTVIIACHDTEELEYLADEIYELYEGKIINHEVI